MTIPVKIKELRKQRGLTQAQLADAVGVSVPHVSQVERGIKNLNNHLLERFAAALRVTPADLIRANAPTDALLDIARTLPENDLENLVRIAEAMKAARR